MLAAAVQKPRALVIADLHEGDATDQELVTILLRRLDPERLQLVITTGDAGRGDALGERHAERVDTIASAPEARSGTAADYVTGDCTSDDPAVLAAYESTAPAERSALHDRRAVELEARDEPSCVSGAIPLHRERGSDPYGAGVAALNGALDHCVLGGFYDAALDLGRRARALLDWAERPEDAWLVSAEVATALTPLGRPDEAAALYDEACAGTTLPTVHLQSAYGRAMLDTRFYEPGRRDHARAKAHINTAQRPAVALADEPTTFLQITLVSTTASAVAAGRRARGDGQRRLGARCASTPRGSPTLLHRECWRLFPDDMFADLFFSMSDAGRCRR